MNTIDIAELRTQLEAEFNFDSVVNEGPDCVRFGKGGGSFWVYAKEGIVDLDNMPINVRTFVEAFTATAQNNGRQGSNSLL